MVTRPPVVIVTPSIRHLAGKTEKALSRLEAIAEESECSDVPLFLTAQLTRLELLARLGHAQKAHEVTATLSAAARAHDASWWIDRANATLARLEIDGSANVKQESLATKEVTQTPLH